MQKVLKSKSKSYPNQYRFTVLPTRKLRTIFQRRNTSYNTTLVLQCGMIQHNTSEAVHYWWRAQIQILVNLPKWYIKTFFCGCGGKNPHNSDPKTDDCIAVSSDGDTCDFAIRMANYPLHPFSYPQLIIITSIAY